MIKQVAVCCLLVLLAGAGKAQTYEFVTDNEPYTELDSSTVVSGHQMWDEEEFSVPIGFNILFLGEIVNQVKVDGNGWVIFSNNAVTGIKKVFIGFGADMASKGTATSLSPISYKLSGLPGERILVIQYKNAGFFNDSAAAYANFQVWLYEYDYAVEVHVGDVKVFKTALAYDGKGGPTVGIFEPDSELTHFIYSLGLSGNPANPVADTMDIHHPQTLDSTPVSGSLYRFVPHAPVGIKQNPSKPLVWIYPNPVASILYVEAAAASEIVVLNTSGQELKHVQASGKITPVDVSDLNPGLYYVRTLAGTQWAVSKISVLR